MTKQGDSIKGFVEVASHYESKIGYKKGLDDAETFIPTKDIKFVLTTGRYLENIALGKHELLMTMVARGKISLFLQAAGFKLWHSSSGSRSHRSMYMVFVVKKGSIYTEVPKKRFREILSALMYDCPEVVEKIREEVFPFEEMAKAVAEYNSCF